MKGADIVFVCLVTIYSGNVLADSHTGGAPYEEEIAYQWNIIEYEWPNSTLKEEAIAKEKYVPKNCAINGIKLYKGAVYVTTPRLKKGVPSTLNVIVENENPNMTSVTHVLRPFPSWDMQKLGDCNALQLVQSMEIDINTGFMWIVDTGFVPTEEVKVRPLDSCPAKIVIYDLENDKEVHRYNFPLEVVGHGLFYLNDIVLGYHNNEARYAFMSETLGYKLVVYDYKTDSSYSYIHENMRASEEYMNITISNITIYGIKTGINGIAMSPDFKYIYYSSVAGVGLHQVETSVLTSGNGDAAKFNASVRTLGEKVAPGDGMVYGARHNLYYSALTTNAVYKWNITNDVQGGTTFENVTVVSHSELVSHTLMDWVDTLALDDTGYLWFTTSRLNKLFSEDGIHHLEPNFIVWKIFVDDYSYMNRTFFDDGQTLGSGHAVVSLSALFICCLFAIVAWIM